MAAVEIAEAELAASVFAHAVQSIHVVDGAGEEVAGADALPESDGFSFCIYDYLLPGIRYPALTQMAC